MKWQDVFVLLSSILLLSGTVTYIDLFGALFNLTGMDYTFTGDIRCGETCESYINITTSYWNVGFEHTSSDQVIYIQPEGYKTLLKTTMNEYPDTVLYKKWRYGRKLWVNMNNVNNIITTDPPIKVDWMVPARGKDNWRMLQDGDSWERGKVNRIKLIGHKARSQSVKWSFKTEKYVDIDPLWIGINSTYLNSDLLAYYTFDTDADDSEGLYNGTVHGATLAAGVLNNSYAFDGSNDYINLSQAWGNFTNNNFSINMWVKVRNDGSHSTFISKGLWGTDEFIFYKQSDVNNAVYINDNLILSNFGIPDNSWNMYTLTKNGTEYKLYWNATLVQTNSTATEVINNTKNWIIGAANDGAERTINGSIDEVGIWNKTLTPYYIEGLYNNGNAKAYPFIPLTYYVSSTGDDSNDGLTTSTPIKTITKVNTFGLVSGDSISFNRGDTWRSYRDGYLSLKSGNSEGNVTYGAYGTGAQPLILGSMEYNNVGNWTLKEPNIWGTNTTQFEQVGNIIFNNEESVGLFAYNYSDLSEQGEYYHNDTINITYMYSPTNPASYYTDIELAIYEDLIEVIDGEYIHINNLDLRYTAEAQFEAQSSNHIYIINNTMKYGGGGFLGSSTLRTGNCLGFSLSTNEMYATGNYVSQCWDACMSSQAWLSDLKGHNITNNYYTYNIAGDCDYPFEYFNTNNTGNTTNLILDHNTFFYTDNAWTGTQGERIDNNIGINEVRVRMAATPDYTKNINITNNIFINMLNYSLSVDPDTGYYIESNALNLDNNSYYKHPDAVYYFNLNYSLNYENLSTWQSATGHDPNSIQRDPLLINVSGYNFTPYDDSVVCLMSTTGSYVGAVACKDVDINFTYGTGITSMLFIPNGLNLDPTTLTLTESNDEVESQSSSNPYTTICNNGTATATLYAWLNTTSTKQVIKCNTAYSTTTATNLTAANVSLNTSLIGNSCNDVYCWMDWIAANETFYFMDNWVIR